MIAAELTVTADVPEEVSVTDRVFAVFTVSLPKLRLEALTVNCGFAAAVPVPLRATAAVPPVVESLLMLSCPVTAPVAVGANWTCSARVWFGFSVAGKVPPTIVKPAPVIAAELTVTADVPEEVSVTDRVFAVFTVSLPKLRLEALTVNCGFAAAVPVPLRATAAVPPVVESLLMLSCPVTAPVAVGANWTCSARLWFGFSVAGKVPPTIVKPAPVIAAELTVTADVPEEVSVTDRVFAVFTVSLPKLRLEALTVNCGFAAAVPVPLRATAAVPPVVESLLMLSCPVTAPVAVGANWTCSARVWFGLSVAGKVPPTIVKPAPVIAAELTVTGDVPEEVSVTDRVFAVFTVSLPKLRLEALTVNCGFAVAVPVPLRATAAVPPVVESLLMLSCPVTAPVAVGANWTCSARVWFGFSVAGKVPPTIVKPAPVIAAELTVTADVPEEVSVNDRVFAVFTVSLPKLRLEALTVNCGFAVAVPVPLRATAAVPPVVESLLMLSCPVTAPVAVGANWTCSVRL